MNPRALKKWEVTRRKGKKHFVWRYGVLAFGVGTAIAWSIFTQIFDPADARIWLRPLIALIVFPIGGYLWGVWFWSSCEKDYLKTKDKNQG
jgi:hypothetical protein